MFVPSRMYTPIFCLLDRNAVALIKDSIAGKAQTDSKKISFLKKLRSFDRPEYYVSPLFSIIEGELGKEDSAEEKAACQRKESEAVRSFFKLAKTDSDFLDAKSYMVGNIFTTYREGSWSPREEFLNGAVPLIVKKLKKDRRKEVEVQLVELAHASKLRSTDPVVVLCLSCLYGSKDARSVIKPHKFNAYNVLSDIHIILRVGAIHALARQYAVPVRVRVVSMDEGLVQVLSHIKLLDSQFFTSEDIQFQVKYLPGLFPELSEDDYLALLNRLDKKTISG